MDALYRLFASDLRIQHAIRGRIRIKIDKVKGNPSLAQELEQRLTAISIVHRATANPLTGSLLILYEPQFLAWFKSPELGDALLQESAAELMAVVELLELRLTYDHVQVLGQWLRTYWDGSEPEAVSGLTQLVRHMLPID
jgi:hypothetical protein